MLLTITLSVSYVFYFLFVSFTKLTTQQKRPTFKMAEPMDLMDALRETLKNSLIVDGVTKGRLITFVWSATRDLISSPHVCNM